MDYFEAVDSDWEESAMKIQLALEMKRSRRINVAILVFSFAAVCAIAWVLR